MPVSFNIWLMPLLAVTARKGTIGFSASFSLIGYTICIHVYLCVYVRTDMFDLCIWKYIYTLCKSVSLLIPYLHNTEMEHYVRFSFHRWAFFFHYLNLISTLTTGIILNHVLSIHAYKLKPLTQSNLANMALILMQGSRRKH